VEDFGAFEGEVEEPRKPEEEFGDFDE